MCQGGGGGGGGNLKLEVNPGGSTNLHIKANFGEKKTKSKIYTESGENSGHDYDVCAYTAKHMCMQICMHAISWHAWVHVFDKLGHIMEVELSMETKGQAF